MLTNLTMVGHTECSKSAHFFPFEGLVCQVAEMQLLPPHFLPFLFQFFTLVPSLLRISYVSFQSSSSFWYEHILNIGNKCEPEFLMNFSFLAFGLHNHFIFGTAFAHQGCAGWLVMLFWFLVVSAICQYTQRLTCISHSTKSHFSYNTSYRLFWM